MAVDNHRGESQPSVHILCIVRGLLLPIDIFLFLGVVAHIDSAF